MSMENETKDFLVLIVNTISLVLLWMMINVFIGIYFGFAFFEGSPNWKNMVYYVCFLASLILLLTHLKKSGEFD
jgi:hypothetical protein